MATASTYGDLGVDIGDDFVATIEFRKPPNNFIDIRS